MTFFFFFLDYPKNNLERKIVESGTDILSKPYGVIASIKETINAIMIEGMTLIWM